MNKDNPYELKNYSLLITCEHASNAIPKEFQELFVEKAVLDTHKGYDPGAMELAQHFADHYKAPLCLGKVSRLLVENNRSLHHPKLFSIYSKSLSKQQKQTILEDYYLNYRKKVVIELEHLLNKTNGVLHLSIHSFTPNLDGQERNADVGLLYDPTRAREKTFCALWKKSIVRKNPSLKVRSNYPYLGSNDSLTTYLRSRYGELCYLGIEVEVNQKFPLAKNTNEWKELQKVLIDSLEEVVR